MLSAGNARPQDRFELRRNDHEAATLAQGRVRAQKAAMEPERPPVVDAEYRVVRGPWPRWAMHLGLVKLGLYSTAVVAGCVLLALGLLALLGVFS